MPKKFYVVWAGRQTGVFTDWAETKKQVDQFPGCKFKSFKTRQEAETAYAAGWSGKRKSPTKKTGSTTALTKPTSRKLGYAAGTGAGSQANKHFDIEVYCDGACEPNPGESGSGIAVYRDGILSELWYGLYDAQGTNNSAELNALYQALLIAKEEIGNGKNVVVRSDSQYSIKCITEWAISWRKKGWKRKKPGDIKNLEVIQISHHLYLEIQADVVISHVSAHVGIEGNELADRMAVFGINQMAPEFCRYSEALDVSEILAFRSG